MEEAIIVLGVVGTIFLLGAWMTQSKCKYCGAHLVDYVRCMHCKGYQ